MSWPNYTNKLHIISQEGYLYSPLYRYKLLLLLLPALLLQLLLLLLLTTWIEFNPNPSDFFSSARWLSSIPLLSTCIPSINAIIPPVFPSFLSTPFFFYFESKVYGLDFCPTIPVYLALSRFPPTVRLGWKSSFYISAIESFFLP